MRKGDRLRVVVSSDNEDERDLAVYVEVLHPGSSGRTSGPPDRWEPPEGPEIAIRRIAVIQVDGSEVEASPARAKAISDDEYERVIRAVEDED